MLLALAHKAQAAIDFVVLVGSNPRAVGGFTYLYRPFKRATPGAATMGRFTSMERMA